MSPLARWLLLLISVWATACDGGVQLVVDLRTDLVAGTEFSAIETRLNGGPAAGQQALPGQDFTGGRRVAEYPSLQSGRVEIDIRLLDATGIVVATRAVELELTEDTGVSVVITRDCVGVSCPDPSASACFGGRCVAQACWDGNPGACGDGECIADADCTSGLGCVVPICVSGACLMPTDHDRCASGQRCDIVLGCVGGPGDGGMCSGPEVCNGIDDDCDPGTVDGADDVTLGLDCDGPDADECDEGTTACVGGRGVCSDDTDDSAETCDGTDEDCDGTIDEGLDCRPGCTQMVRAGTTYLFCPDTLDWTEAFTACGEIGYHLVKIEDAEENDFLVTAALSIVFDDWWIGLNDRGREGEHIWHDGTNADAFSAWRRGQPDNDSNEDCDEINDVDMGAWNDRPCTYDSNFICEANPP